MQTIEELKEEKKKLLKEQKCLQKEYQKLTHSLTQINETLKIINNEIDSKTLDKNDIVSLLQVFPETKIKRKYLNEYFKKWEHGLGTGTYFPDTEQSCITITLYRDDDKHTEMVCDGIKELLPVVKPLKNGNKTFSIFESTLSYHNSYYLVQPQEKNMFQIITHIDRVCYESESLMDTLKYIQKYYYYEKGLAPK